MNIETDLIGIEILLAIDHSLDILNRVSGEKNQFADAIMDIDMAEADKAIEETGKINQTIKVLHRLAVDIQSERPPEPESEYEV